MAGALMTCLNCPNPCAPAKPRGPAPRFCSIECRKDFNNMRMVRGALIYDLFRIMRRERDIAKRDNLWTEMCRLELSWNDQDKGARRWKSAEMALADIVALDRPPTTNLYLKPKKKGV
jgi:hypothetical protein